MPLFVLVTGDGNEIFDVAVVHKWHCKIVSVGRYWYLKV